MRSDAVSFFEDDWGFLVQVRFQIDHKVWNFKVLLDHRWDYYLVLPLHGCFEYIAIQEERQPKSHSSKKTYFHHLIPFHNSIRKCWNPLPNSFKISNWRVYSDKADPKWIQITTGFNWKEE